MKCKLCPRRCGIDRENAKGFCGANSDIKIAKYCLFSYEEPCISGKGGSGAVFFSGCSLKCVFCQNYEISSLNSGKEISITELAKIFKILEDQGADNINLVNPTHYVYQIVEALKIYKPNIPIIYNSHGYERVETLKYISPYIDVFLPDFKYFSECSANKYSNCSDYVVVAKKALITMRELKKDVYENGLIKQGLIIRHMIMPLLTDESIEILKWIKDNLKDTKVSLMAQYTPYARAKEFSEIDRKITKREYTKVVDAYLELNLDGYIQERESANTLYIPSWDFKGF